MRRIPSLLILPNRSDKALETVEKSTRIPSAGFPERDYAREESACCLRKLILDYTLTLRYYTPPPTGIKRFCGEKGEEGRFRVRKGNEWWVAGVGAAILLFLFFYNRQPYVVYSLHWLGWKRGAVGEHRSLEEYLLVNTAALFWLPLLVVALIGKGELKEYGLARGEGLKGVLLALAMYGLMVPLLWFASKRPEFQTYYPLDKRILHEPARAVYFELAYGYYLFCWEFFFRGFLTFGLSRWIGKVAGLVVQAIAFGLMHIGKPVPEMIGAFGGGFVLGWVALQVRSFLPCFWTHWAVSATLDLLLIFGIHSKR